MNYLLYNPKANNGRGTETAEQIAKTIKEAEMRSLLEIKDIKAFFNGLKPEDEVYFTGGDGTLNHLVNDLDGLVPTNTIYYIKSGSGNDFYNDSKQDEKDGKIVLNRYLANLPTVTVNGIKRKFINGIGYGIDGETCRIGDEQRASSDKPVNYGSIAVKLCLGAYKKNIASVSVDGKQLEYKDVWLASTMKGKYYGGGMKVAPEQDRFNDKGTLTFVCLHKRSRIVTLLRFTSLFKGEHVKWHDWCQTIVGKSVKVNFKYPCAIQIDGEVIPAVTSYTVEAETKE